MGCIHGLQQQHVTTWEQSKAPLWHAVKDLLLWGECEFTLALKNVFANTFICAAKNNATSSFWLKEQGLALPSARASAVLQQEKGNHMKYVWVTAMRPLHPQSPGKGKAQWLECQLEQQHISQALVLFWNLMLVAGKWCSMMFCVGEHPLLFLQQLSEKML